jgi:signal transduction histidine kinase
MTREQTSKPRVEHGTRPEREHTDESLRKERDKSDHEVGRRFERETGVADAVMERARTDADEVLRATRHEEDPRPSKQQAAERQREDASIQRKRDAADGKLDGERHERTRALATLFAMERELTDQRLSTERSRADLALNNRDDFLGMVAHDLRGFMGEIAFRSAMMMRDAGDGEAGERNRQNAKAIQRSTGGMKRLIGDLLDIAAIEAGRLRIEVSTGDVANMLRDALEPLKFAAETKGIALDLEEAPESVTAIFDHDRVVQVLGNLVGNAIKFTPKGGKISLRLSAGREEVKLTVADNGPGIPPDKLEAVFERFTQVIESDRGGLGLGLYIARCLIHAHGGRIWAASELGAGSTFCFTLPLATSG